MHVLKFDIASTIHEQKFAGAVTCKLEQQYLRGKLRSSMSHNCDADGSSFQNKLGILHFGMNAC